MSPKRVTRLINIARKLQNRRTGQSLHFSFVLSKNKILCWATNDYSNKHLEHRFGKFLPSKKESNYKPCRHSECEVLKTFVNKFGSSDVSGLTLFNVRIDKKGNPMNAKPCANCDREVVQPLNWKDVSWTGHDQK